MAHYCYATNCEHRRATNVRGLKTVWLRLLIHSNGLISSMVGYVEDQNIRIRCWVLERPTGWVELSSPFNQYQEKIRRGV